MRNKITELCKKHRFKQKDVSRILGINCSRLSQLANGLNTPPTKDEVEKLCRFFSESESEIFEPVIN